MPPKIRYTRAEVVAAAVAVVEAKGLSALTARSVADQLGASTAPVYQYFATMDELTLAVIKEIQKALLEYAARPYTDRVFLNMGTGVAMFALEHRRLYKALMLEETGYGNVVSEFLDILSKEMKKDNRFAVLSDSERYRLLNKMWTYTHGMASLICVGLIKSCDKNYIINSLIDVGGDVIGATLAKHANTTKKKPEKRRT